MIMHHNLAILNKLNKYVIDESPIPMPAVNNLNETPIMIDCINIIYQPVWLVDE